MNNTGQLRYLMALDAYMNTFDIEKSFEKIAQMLFESFAIQKGKAIYLFKEIEFYFYNKSHRDIITHPRISKPMCWYINDFGGIDLNFASSIEYENRPNKGKNVKKYVLDDNAHFGGILIRQLIEKEKGEVLNGPWACAEVFRSYDATGVDINEDLPVLIESDNGTISYKRDKRINLLSSNQDPKKKVDNILYLYHEHPDKEILYKEFEKFKDKPYRYERQTTS